MSKSLQKIEDYYVGQGLSGDDLRHALENDNEYQKILADRKKNQKVTLNITDDEVKKYVLSTDADYEILAKIHQLEKYNLSNTDKELVRFINTQLELDWRSPINSRLDALIDKYSSN